MGIDRKIVTGVINGKVTTYDPSKVVFLKTLRDPVTGGMLSVASPETHMEPVQESALSKFLAIAKPIAAILVTLAGSVIAAGQGGLTLPAWLVSVCTAIVAVGAGLGIASSGTEKKKELPPSP